MPGPVVDQGIDDALVRTVGNPEWNGAQMTLWGTGAWVPSHTDTASDYLATGTDGAGQITTLTVVLQPVTWGGIAVPGPGRYRQIIGGPILWTNATLGSITAYGYAILDTTGLVLLGAVAFAGPQVILPGDTLPVIPILQAQSAVA